MSDNNFNEEVLNELKKISKLLVINLTEGKNQTEVIEILGRIGFQPKNIAELLGTTANSVRVTLSNSRNKK